MQVGLRVLSPLSFTALTRPSSTARVSETIAGASQCQRLAKQFYLLVIGGGGTIENHGIVEHSFQVRLHLSPGRIRAVSEFITHLSEAHGPLNHRRIPWRLWYHWLLFILRYTDNISWAAGRGAAKGGLVAAIAGLSVPQCAIIWWRGKYGEGRHGNQQWHGHR